MGLVCTDPLRGCALHDKKSGGQSGEKQLGRGRLMEDAEPGHVTPTSQCEETKAASVRATN